MTIGKHRNVAKTRSEDTTTQSRPRPKTLFGQNRPQRRITAQTTEIIANLGITQLSKMAFKDGD